ncbi:hypothetical protein EUX98_g4986 [Antrodiella citrinella]|uniref:Uncharacterized protein n=1 Tax=Antrodiella citrinella TaxID=2447956 RepID=A0A4S4MSP1_9APHY|nr:hypothetical protein EUX98_g4986 [Antrodiella citrinella]
MAAPTSESKELVWFITGTSSGFGKRLVAVALARGDKVIATARSTSSLQDLPTSDRLRTMQLDVIEGRESIKRKVDDAVSYFGRIDVLVNNAGIGEKAFVEEGGSEVFLSQINVNVCGLLDVTTAILPYMRAQKSGTIVMIGSRSSWESEVPIRAFYCSSKAALRVLSEGLQSEVSQFGVRVLIVEPGPFRTENIYARPLYEGNRIPVYDSMLKFIDEYVKTKVDGFQPGDPLKAMEVLADVVRGEGCAEGKKFPLYLPLGEEAEQAIRNKCNTMLGVVDEWQDVIRSTKLDEA